MIKISNWIGRTFNVLTFDKILLSNWSSFLTTNSCQLIDRYTYYHVIVGYIESVFGSLHQLLLFIIYYLVICRYVNMDYRAWARGVCFSRITRLWLSTIGA